MSRYNSEFDPGLDKELWSESIGDGPRAICVSVRSYDGDAPKISLARPNGRLWKLGRLTLEEARALPEVLNRAAEILERQLDGKPTKAEVQAVVASSPVNANAGGDADEANAAKKRKPRFGGLGAR